MEQTQQQRLEKVAENLARVLQAIVNVAETRPDCAVGHLIEHGPTSSRARSVLMDYAIVTRGGD